ncbi:MAG TPA: hypothetical protein VMC07_00800 [Candidatus Omnitrophota bacterium]|nr:hypothetical protein [Candidatus Omnitrophota bacterium]
MSIELTVQEKRDYCVCSVLQAVFRKHGLEISQEEIAGNLTHGEERGFKIDDKRIREFFLRNGFIYTPFGEDETPFNEPDGLLKEMQKHDGIIGIENHVYLLETFQDPRVMLIDPKDGQEVEKNYYQLLREMKNGGFFGLIINLYGGKDANIITKSSGVQ